MFAEYDAQCQREGVVDFSELLLRCYELLSCNHATARALSGALQTYPGGRVPGHQPAAIPLAEVAGRARQRALCGGDDDQSIYAFRGANVGNMQELMRDFHVENVIKLEQNYRSHGNILDAANALIQHNRNRLGKNLWTAEAAASHCACMRHAPMATRRLDRRGDPGSSIARAARREIALLYRSNAQSRIWNTRWSPPAFPTACTAACAFSSAGNQARAGLPAPDGEYRRRHALLRIVNFPRAASARAASSAAGSGQE